MPTLQKLTSFSLRLCASAAKSLDFVFPESPLLAVSGYFKIHVVAVNGVKFTPGVGQAIALNS